MLTLLWSGAYRGEKMACFGDSSRIDCPFIDGQRPGFTTLCILSTRDEPNKALAELRSASNSHRGATEITLHLD